MMRERMNRAMGGGIPDNGSRDGGDPGFQQSSTIRMMDNEGSIEIRTSDGQTDVTVRDEKNDEVWSEPWNSEEQKKAAPDSIRERIERVRPGGGSGFSFRFGTGRDRGSKTLDN